MGRKKEMSQKVEIVKKILYDNPATRVNYNELYIAYFRATGQSLNLVDHISDAHNEFESIARARRKVQENDPFLRDVEFVKEEQEMKEWAREEL